MHERERVVAQILAGENGLFDALVSYLNDDQSRRMSSVRNARVVDRWREYFRTSPGTNIDITLALQALADDGFDVQPNDPERMETDLREYRTALADGMSGAMNSFLQDMVVTSPIHDAMQQFADATIARQRAGESVDEAMFIEEYKAVKDQLIPFNARHHEARRRIRDLNREYIDRFASNLPEETAAELTSWFQENAYPAVYPDPFDARSVLRGIAELTTLSEQQIAAIAPAHDHYLKRSDMLSVRMVHEYLAWWAHMELEGGYSDEEYDQYAERMSALQVQRRELARETVKFLTSLLDAEQRARTEPALARFSEAISNNERVLSKRGDSLHGWPGARD